MWSSIDSAPLDGTTVDLWCERSWEPGAFERSTDMYWCTTHECWRQRGHEHYVDFTWRPGREPIDRHLIPTMWAPIILPDQIETRVSNVRPT
jgi:hypothetical protein